MNTNDTAVIDAGGRFMERRAAVNIQAGKYPVYSLEDSMDHIRNEEPISFDDIEFIYLLTAAHNREDLLAQVSKDPGIPAIRKSMLLQVAHYSENNGSPERISLYMALAIYYGLQQEEQPGAISELGKSFVQRTVNFADTEKLIMHGLSSEPWKFSGNERTRIITSLRVFERAMNSSRS